LAKGDFIKWREHLKKIFGESDPDINRANFDRCQEEFTKTLNRENAAFKERVTKYVDQEAITKKVKAKLLDMD
jgi:acid phosphatase class B